MGVGKLCLPICLLVLFPLAGPQNPVSIQLVGVGSTAPVAIYSLWFREFQEIHPNIHFSYLPSGSSVGIEMISSGKADFGGTDFPMTSSQLSKAGVLQLPTVLGAVVPVYNVPGADRTVKFSQQILARIYLGKIKRWNDPALVQLNPEVQLPASEIVVFHGSDGRGTTYIWSEFLSKVSEEWRTAVGSGAAISWPTGVVAEGNGNLADAVKRTPNSIGYVWLAYAFQQGLAYGAVQNAAGNFVTPNAGSIAAAAAAKIIPADFRVSMTNPPGKQSYPIISFTWLLVPVKADNAEKQEAMRQFLYWMLSDGQNYAAMTGFVKLPAAVVTKELQEIKKRE
jgi:phosphate transport system substrate-binding protein